MTSVANHEIHRISGDRYIPGGILPISEGGHLIQEGSDNIDLNTETLDGKNTFHSLARAVFQIKSTGDYDYGSERINRGNDRSLSIDDTTSSLTDAIPYSKPKFRAEPSRRSDAFDKLQSCVNGRCNVIDHIWVLSRLLTRDIVELPLEFQATGQTIPFWTGFNCLLSERRPDITVVAYPPIIDAKPNDMATVYTAMKKCLDMTNEAGQEHAIQTFDQQLYAIAQQVKWSKPDIFNRHILRLGGFHSLSSIGKLWADGVFVIFWLILACMLETQLSLCWLAKNLTGLSGGSHLYLKPYKFCLSRHSYTGVGPLTTSIRYHQHSGMRCLNFIEVSVIRRLKHQYY